MTLSLRRAVTATASLIAASWLLSVAVRKEPGVLQASGRKGTFNNKLG